MLRLRAAAGTLVSREIAVITNAIAFNFLLCLFPLLLVVAALSLRLPGGGRGTALLLVLQELIPFGREPLTQSVQSLTRLARGVELLSLLAIAWGSSGIFIPVEMALNRAWGGRGDRGFLLSRLLAFAMTLAGGGLALASVAVTVLARSYGPGGPRLASAVGRLSALLLTYVLFFLIYRFVPQVAVGSRTALRAALWGGTAWEAAKYAFVWNLARTNLQAFYGPLAFAVALVLWAYVSSLALVFGALMAPLPKRRS